MLDRAGQTINNPGMSARACPSCRKSIPPKLLWRTLVAGQTAHRCPACGQRFRLTYAAKRRVAFFNVAPVLGLAALLGYALYGDDGQTLLRFALLYAGALVLVLAALPHLARFEKTSAPYR